MAETSINTAAFMDYNLERALEIKSILIEFPCPLGSPVMA